MTYAIIGFGKVGQALARAFARAGIEVSVAATRAPQALEAAARAIGPGVTPTTLENAITADVLLLAAPFWSHRDIGALATRWDGKIVIDATNASGVPLAELDNLPSSVIVAKAFPRARLVKAFNHLPASVLAQDPATPGGRRVIFLSSDDESANATVAALVERLGFAPVSLGRLAEGGQLVQARDKSWAPLIFQDLSKQAA
jgi:8-hydroxy-5-deazaflavin:NADPH oxidoreductase